MSKNILFISEDLVKDRAAVNENVDPKLITPAIKYCQDVYIEPVLGTDLFRKIQADIDSGDIITDVALAEYKALLDDYIVDVLLYYVLSELPIMLGYKFFNKNVLKKNSENSTDAQNFELHQLATWYKNKAEYYEKNLIKYLAEESVQAAPVKFPEYNSTPGRCDFMVPKKKAYTSSIYLGNPGKKKLNFGDIMGNGGDGDMESNIIDGGGA